MLERKLVPHQQIRKFGIFRELSEELVEEVRQNAWTLSLAANDVLFRQNDTVRRVYFCLAGQMKLFRLTHTGSEKIFLIASPSDSLYDSIPLKGECLHTLNCTAIAEAEVLSVAPDVIVEILNRSSDARIHLVDSLIQRMADLIDHVELLSVDKANFRVASYLLNEYHRNGQKGSFRLSSSKKYIASYLALQPETLSRCLRSFRQDGIASSVNRDVNIHDPARLEQMVLGIDTAA